jgi:hypothetical protein
MSAEEYEAALGDLARIALPGGRVAFWTMFVPAPYPKRWPGGSPDPMDGVFRITGHGRCLRISTPGRSSETDRLTKPRNGDRLSPLKMGRDAVMSG